MDKKNRNKISDKIMISCFYFNQYKINQRGKDHSIHVQEKITKRCESSRDKILMELIQSSIDDCYKHRQDYLL